MSRNMRGNEEMREEATQNERRKNVKDEKGGNEEKEMKDGMQM